MTNYERLLDLPLREFVKEFDKNADIKEFLLFILEAMIGSNGFAPPCETCENFSNNTFQFYKICGSSDCMKVCLAWLNCESASDANYNDDRWHGAAKEDPPTSDVTIEYIVLVDGAELPTTLIFDGDSWRDHSGAYYRVALWRPMPKLPEEVINNAD